MKKVVLMAATLVAAAVLAAPTAQADSHTESEPKNHGQCVRNSPKPDGKGGRSDVARSQECRDAKPDPEPEPETIDCTDAVENGIVDVDESADTATITGEGPGSDGSSLECFTSYEVTAGEEIVFDYAFGSSTDPCGGGVPRVFVRINGTYYNTFDGDTDCSESDGDTITYTIPVTGTVTETGLVYDRGDSGSITYSDISIAGMDLDL